MHKTACQTNDRSFQAGSRSEWLVDPGRADFWLLCCGWLAGVAGAWASEALPLAGEWRFALDRSNAGIEERWFNRDLADRIQLPGVLQAQGYGDEISTNTPWVLSLHDRNWFLRDDYRAYTQPGNVKVPFVCQPPRHYLGAAWYQRDIEIPTNWAGQRVVLFLERARWETRAWLDDRPIGTNNSLCVPHLFEAGVVGSKPDQIQPGRHRVTVRCDNRMLMPYRPDAHAVSDSLASTWNGVAGRIELRTSPLVSIERIRLQPNIERKGVEVVFHTRNETGQAVAAPLLMLQVAPANFGGNALKPVRESAVIEPGQAALTLFFPMGDSFEPWCEFNPRVYRLRATLGGSGFHSESADTFGMREVQASGQDLVINARPTHFRGTHHGGDFPLTGYPPCDVEYWLKLFRICKEWGLNHVRFHSFCPPEAAFAAADEVGLYLQIEPGMWNDISPGTAMEAMLYAETDRILKAYGNHPSFVLMSASNEAKGRWKEALPQWVRHFRELDPRRLYTPDTGWSLIDVPGPVQGADYLAVHRIGQNLMRGDRGWFGRDYARATRGVNVPIVTHEVGQWCAYPDFEVIQKFTGYMRPGNFEIFRDSAAANGLMPWNRQFALASGRFQLACYKEDIEANLRTPGLAGFQLLDLHDYVGQGTALVGVLDPFWGSKGYVNADEWRQFCSPVVPLARMTRRVFTTADTLEVPVEVANYSAAALTNAVVAWHIQSDDTQFPARGQFVPMTLPIGRTTVGTITASLAMASAPARYRLAVNVSEPSAARAESARTHANVWNLWLYPAQVDASVPNEVLLSSSWDEAEARLAAGGRVVFQPPQAHLDWSCPPLDKLPVFWNRLMGPGWSRMLGLGCDANHPALAGFPTEGNCDWQWTEIIKTRAINLDRLPCELSPVVSAIDDWNRNWKLGLIFEARVGSGRLLVSAFDLSADSPVARQLRRSLLDYAAGAAFQPKCQLAAADLRGLWFDTLVMRKLGAVATADSGVAAAAIDGDPNTYWLTEAPARNAVPSGHPHELTVRFPQPVEVTGVVLMNRQNDRDHQGDIAGYTLSASRDGQNWAEVARGQLGSTWRPQTIRLARPVTVTQLKLTALSGHGQDPGSSLAELAVLMTGTALPDNKEIRLDYRRVRSTSTDIDEGETPRAP